MEVFEQDPWIQLSGGSLVLARQLQSPVDNYHKLVHRPRMLLPNNDFSQLCYVLSKTKDLGKNYTLLTKRAPMRCSAMGSESVASIAIMNLLWKSSSSLRFAKI